MATRGCALFGPRREHQETHRVKKSPVRSRVDAWVDAPAVTSVRSRVDAQRDRRRASLALDSLWILIEIER